MNWSHGVLLALAIACACETTSPATEPSLLADPTPDLPVVSETPPPTTIPLPPAPPNVTALNRRRVELLAAGKLEEAARVCETWISKPTNEARAEGHKCLANVLVKKAKDTGSRVMISDRTARLTVGGMAAPPRFSGPELARAIDQLDEASTLAPSDLSIHQGRLFLCMASGDYTRAVESLEASLNQYEGATARTWLEYMPSFPPSAAEQASAFAELIVKANPDSSQALVELGAWQLERDEIEKAKTSLQKAISIAPKNALAHWRMGEALEKDGDRKRARAAFRKSLSLRGPLAEERREAYKRFDDR